MIIVNTVLMLIILKIVQIVVQIITVIYILQLKGSKPRAF